MSTDSTAWPQPANQPPAERRRGGGIPGWLKGLGLLILGLLLGVAIAPGESTETSSRRPTETVTETVTERADEVAAEVVTETVTERVTETVTEAGQAATAPAPAPAPAAPAPALAGGQPASSFSDGIYIIGTDVAPGTYRTTGGTGSFPFCSLIQYADLSREISGNLGAAQGEGPMIFQATTEGSVLEAGGGCEWALSG